MIAVAIAIIVFASMLLEARVSRRHDQVLRAQGALEPADDVYPVMQAAYPAVFLAMLAEGVWRRPPPDAALVVGGVVFVAAKALKYWAIRSLGTRWTFRVLVPPRSGRIVAGPYRWLRHPNYVAVVGELVGTAIGVHALVTGPLAVAVFGLLMLVRVRVEERALGQATE